MNRRQLLASATATAASYRRILGANDRIQLGIIGTGNRGGQVWRQALGQPDAAPAAVCDVYEPHLESALSAAQGQAKAYRDFRSLLEHRPMDAVLIATPDHWHALQTIMACRAGLDVYVEKPLSLTVQEGRKMVDAARQHERVVQTGSQQRSGPHYAEAVEIVRSGELGDVHHVEAGMERNSMPGFGTPQDAAPPADFNYDMWLGPAPARPYNPLRGHYHFRWFWDYSGGQMTNWGAHNIDIARWGMDIESPNSVMGCAGRFAIRDNGETPDLQEVLYEVDRGILTWSVRELNGTRGAFLVFHGTKADLAVDRSGYSLRGQKWQKEERAMARDRESRPGNAARELTAHHIRNFLDCVKSRERPNADVEIGHRTAVFCHLGNIAARLGRALRWDGAQERFAGDEEANRSLSKPYRSPWTLDI
ncbi:MAG: Gfo/Idh/MocA family oxidoreductase [Bryobacterales bacterium]|nr:Gfo/Idh/MocA family oxidoreductase [Bryobacterales bacterium]